MSLEPILNVLATLLATFLGPWYAFKLAREHQDRKEVLEKQAACVHLTLSVLRDYEDHEFSKRRVTLAEFQRDWEQKKDLILDIVFPARGQLATTFFGDDPNAPPEEEGVHTPVWCEAIPKLESILGLRPL